MIIDRRGMQQPLTKELRKQVPVYMKTAERVQVSNGVTTTQIHMRFNGYEGEQQEKSFLSKATGALGKFFSSLVGRSKSQKKEGEEVIAFVDNELDSIKMPSVVVHRPQLSQV